MEELSEFTSEVVEFKPAAPPKQKKFVDNCTGVGPPQPQKNESTSTHERSTMAVQTERQPTVKFAPVDDEKLARWLLKIMPAVEKELGQGTTPQMEKFLTENRRSASTAAVAKIQTYQKLSLEPVAENSRALAAWLAVHANNAPALVVSLVPSHDNWCEHFQQSLKVFVPKRIAGGDAVVFTEITGVPVKSCLQSLCTNPFNKNIFVGSTQNDEIVVWQLENTSGRDQTMAVRELHNIASPHGYALAMDWSSEDRLVTCHANGWVVHWVVGQQMTKEVDYRLKPLTQGGSNEITSILCLGLSDFVVGTNDGSVYQRWKSGVTAASAQMEVTELRRHAFAVTSLHKTTVDGVLGVISCDLSGQIHMQDMHALDEDSDTGSQTIQLPLPFKDTIACARDASVIYAPGNEGSLECYHVKTGVHSTVKGDMRGRGSLVKISDNGSWILTGLYGNELQVFCLEN